MIISECKGRHTDLKRKVFSRKAPKLSLKKSSVKNITKINSSETRIKITKGSLSKFGYNVHDLPMKRHLALKRAIAIEGPLTVSRSLQARANLNLTINPKISRLMSADARYVRKLSKK